MVDNWKAAYWNKTLEKSEGMFMQYCIWSLEEHDENARGL